MTPCLILDEDHTLQDILHDGLQSLGLHVNRAASPELADARTPYALVLVHVRIPTEGELRLCESLRLRWPALVVAYIPRCTAADRVLAMMLGADAVIDGSQTPHEIRASLMALLRRRPEVTLPDWRLDHGSRVLHAPNGTRVSLSASETQILGVLLEEPHAVLSRGELLARTSLGRAGHHINLIDLSVSRLRKKLQDAGLDTAPLRTVRGQGYSWSPSDDQMPSQGSRSLPP